jgi:hypothetical protein
MLSSLAQVGEMSLLSTEDAQGLHGYFSILVLLLHFNCGYKSLGEHFLRKISHLA